MHIGVKFVLIYEKNVLLLFSFPLKPFYVKGSPYACKMAVCPTTCRWGNRSSLLSHTACVPLRRWSAPCCALWSCPPLPCWHGQVCQDPHRCLKSHLQKKITRHGAMKTRHWRCHPPKLFSHMCSQKEHFKLEWQWFTTRCFFMSSRQTA